MYDGFRGRRRPRFHVQMKLHVFRHQFLFPAFHPGQYNHLHHRRDNRHKVKTDSQRQSNTSRSPQSGRRGQSPYLFLVGDDAPRPQKSNTANYLRAQTGRIPRPVTLIYVLTRQHYHRRADADQYMGSHARRLPDFRPVQSNQASGNGCHENTDENRRKV